MLYYVKEFQLDKSKKIVSNTVSTFYLNEGDIEIIEPLLKSRGQLVFLDNEDVIVLEDDLGIIQKQNIKISTINVSGNSSYNDHIKCLLNEFFRPSFDEDGLCLDVYFNKGLKGLEDNIDVNDSNLVISSFIAEENLYISNMFGVTKRAACPKCHLYHFLSGKSDSVKKHLPDWKKYFRFLMQNELEELSANSLSDECIRSATNILIESVKNQIVVGYSNSKTYSKSYYLSVNLKSYLSTVENAKKYYSCECQYHG